MSLELIYTSAPRGLRPNTSGFCTVAATTGMPKHAFEKLEMLSGYEFCYNISDARADQNPVNFMHTLILIGGAGRHVLSRIAYSGADHTARTNKIAHHFLLEEPEMAAAGPAWMLSRLSAESFRRKWDEPAAELPQRSFADAPGGAQPADPAPAKAWQERTGDAGWAGELARAFREDKKVPAYVIYKPGTDLLPLFQESLALLPAEERWSVCFATYYTALPTGCRCHWRGVVAGSKAAGEAGRFPSAVVIDLTRAAGPAPENEFTAAARRGEAVAPLAKAPAARAARPEPRRRERAFEAAVAEAVAAAPAEAGRGGAPRPAGYPAGAAPAGWGQRSSRLRRLVIALGALAAILALANAWTFSGLMSAREDADGLRRKQTELQVELARARVKAEDAEESVRALRATIAELRGSKPGPEPPKPPVVRDPVPEPPKPPVVPRPGPKPPKPPKPTPPTPPAVTRLKLKPPMPRRDRKVRDFQRRPVAPTSVKRNQIVFDIGKADTFLDMPGVLTSSRAFTSERGRENMTIKCRSASGLSKKVLEYWIEDVGGAHRLMLEIPEDAGGAGDYTKTLESLVIEVVEEGNRVIYQCSRRQPPAPETIVLGFKPDGTPIVPARKSYSYLWASVLEIVDAEDELLKRRKDRAGTALPVLELDPPVQGFAKPVYTFEFDRPEQGPKWSIRVSTNATGEIVNEVKKRDQALADQNGKLAPLLQKRKELGAKKGQLAKVEQEMKIQEKLVTDVDKKTAALKDSAKKLRAQSTSLTASINKLVDQRDKIDTQLKKRNADKKKLQAEKTRPNGQIQKKTTERDKLDKALKAEQQQIKQAEAEKKRLLGLPELRRTLPADIQKLEKQIEKLPAQQQAVKKAGARLNEMTNIMKKLSAQAGLVKVIDPWDVPVATFELRFQPAGLKEILAKN